jgi:hypothetical protein
MTLENGCTPYLLPGEMCVNESYPHGEDCAEACMGGICCNSTVANCVACANATGFCDACEEGYTLVEGVCEFGTTAEPESPNATENESTTTESPEGENETTTESPEDGSENGTTSEPDTAEPDNQDGNDVGASTPVVVAFAAVASVLVAVL